jgi:hypothetical protein
MYLPKEHVREGSNHEAHHTPQPQSWKHRRAVASPSIRRNYSIVWLSPASTQTKSYYNHKHAIASHFTYSLCLQDCLNYLDYKIAKMPGLIQEPHFEHITIKGIGSTFAAEVGGVDFSKEIPQEVFEEIVKAITKASQCSDLIHPNNLAVWRPRFRRHGFRRYPAR